MRAHQRRALGLRILLLTVTALVALVSRAPLADASPRAIRANVMIVRPQYHQETRVAFAQWAQNLAELADKLAQRGPEVAQAVQLLRLLAVYYHGLSQSPGHGSGWLWMPPKGDRAYVVTNKHVAGQAGSVTLEFTGANHVTLPDNEVIYVDEAHDVAIVEVSRRSLPPGANGFELIDTQLDEGSPVWAAGFPGTDTANGTIAAYSLTKGIVSNAEFPGREGVAIAHTATIDAGNSGGPLLIEVPTDDLGFRVGGMNTWKLTTRTNVNLAVPMPVIRDVLHAAIASRAIANDRRRLAESLRQTAERLADELGSSQPDGRFLDALISYSFVAKRPQIIGTLVQSMITGQMSEGELKSFLESPVEYARKTLGTMFVLVFAKGLSRVGEVRLVSITDSSRVSTHGQVRTIYQIGSERQEIMWTWEHGAWRVNDASFEQALVRAIEHGVPAPESTHDDHGDDGDAPGGPGATVASVPRRAMTVRAAFGNRGASGDGFGSDLDSYGSTSFGVEGRTPIGRHLWFGAGLAYAPLGTEYLVLAGGNPAVIREDVTYLQLPVFLRLELARGGKTALVRVFGRAGLSLDIAAKSGGSFEYGGQMGSLSDPDIDWYHEHNFLNVGALVGGGIEVGLGTAPSLFVGVDVTNERHLLSEWTDQQFTGGANYRYGATRVGLTLTYQAWKSR